jgi:hypothetical protein
LDGDVTGNRAFSPGAFAGHNYSRVGRILEGAIFDRGKMGLYYESAPIVAHHTVVKHEVRAVAADIVDYDLIIHRIICRFGVDTVDSGEVEVARDVTGKQEVEA